MTTQVSREDLRVLFEGRSGEGRLVRQSLECNDYFGAAPYFTLAYGVRPESKGHASVLRYTPHRERAEALRHAMLLDRTDPLELKVATIGVLSDAMDSSTVSAATPDPSPIRDQGRSSARADDPRRTVIRRASRHPRLRQDPRRTGRGDRMIARP
jgi:hypothetical protein